MRSRRGLIALFGIAFLLQACRNTDGVPTNSFYITNTSPPAATDPAVTQTAATPPTPEGEFFSPIPFRSGLAFRGPWLDLIFIDPTNSFAQREVGSVDGLVAASIVAAKQSVDISLRTLRVDSITSALIATSRRGIPVRVVAESDSLAGSSHFRELSDAGIPIVDDQQPGLMNASFVVVDHNQVWTGSVDYDLSGVYRKYNAAIRIDSPELAASYTKEFEEMFLNNQFGPFVAPETPYPSLMIEGTQVEVLFSPDDLVLTRLSQLLRDAQHSIYFLAYAFVSNDLGSIIREKAAQGVTVAGILEGDLIDRDQPNPSQEEQWNLLLEAGIDVRLDGGPEQMNHKIIIIDEEIVIMGSYDFTNRAEAENDENVLIIYDERVAQKFIEEFERVQSRAQK